MACTICFRQNFTFRISTKTVIASVQCKKARTYFEKRLVPTQWWRCHNTLYHASHWIRVRLTKSETYITVWYISFSNTHNFSHLNHSSNCLFHKETWYFCDCYILQQFFIIQQQTLYALVTQLWSTLKSAQRLQSYGMTGLNSSTRLTLECRFSPFLEEQVR